ncbi:MAG TPA: ABC transporter permease [bacterium]|nr:ABC transporter permease [bacterium]
MRSFEPTAELRNGAAVAGRAAPPRRRLGTWRTWRRFVRYRPGVAGLVVVLAIGLVAIFAHVLAPYSPLAINPGMRGVGPTGAHLLGFDQIGRDILSRLVYGSRVAMVVAVLATGIAVTIGVAIGTTAGYLGGRVDAVLSRITDALMAFPILVLLIALVAVVGPSLTNVILVIGATVWASYARVVRAEVLSLREQEFVVAARAVGATDRRVIWRHLVPNVVSPVIVLATLSVGNIIILEAALSFLGLGVRPPTPDWGGMLADGRAFITIYPQIVIAPGIVIAVTVLAFNLLGDGLRDALDPRHHD